jgi:hypothetical protein
MARPQRNTVDYYPHMVGDGKKMFFIEKKYGNDGYSTWHKILEKLCATDNHFLNLNQEEEIMYLAAKCNVSEEVLLSIISDVTKMGSFDRELWEHKIIWCQQLVDSIQDAYNKRTNNCITLLGLRELLTDLGILKLHQCEKSELVNPQSRVEESKVKKSRELLVPLISDVRQYFIDNGYEGKVGERAFNYYDVAGWKDSKGNPVISWKQKMQSVWFKDENKIKEQPKRTLVH